MKEKNSVLLAVRKHNEDEFIFIIIGMSWTWLID